MTDAITKAVAIMDEAYLEYSRAKDKDDKVAMAAAMKRASAAAKSTDDPYGAFELHKLNMPKLLASRRAERLSADIGIPGIEVTVVDLTGED